MSKIEIRLAKLSEVDELVRLTLSCGEHLRTLGISQWSADYPNKEIISADISKKQLFVLTENSVPQAIVVLNEVSDPEYADVKWLTPKTSKNLFVHRLATNPKSQGKGYARKLMDFAENYARENNYDSIRLDTFSQNLRNQKFYDARGYHNLGELWLSYKNDFPYIAYELIV